MSTIGQRAYLEALDIPVWIRKELAESVPEFIPPVLKLGPGSSQLLLVCSSVHEPARRIAVDIARCLKSEPVWAWPDDGGSAQSMEKLVGDQLFTTVLVFGESLASSLFRKNMPETLGAARMLQTFSLEELENSPSGKRALWKMINANHLAGPTVKKNR